MLGTYYLVCLLLIDPSGDVALSVAYTSWEVRKRMGLELDKCQSHQPTGDFESWKCSGYS